MIENGSFDDNIDNKEDEEGNQTNKEIENFDNYMESLEERIMSAKRRIADAEEDYK